MVVISNDMFHQWKHDPVTMAFMKNLEEARNVKIKEMLAPDVIRSPNSRELQHEFLGGLDVIEQILNLDINDLIIEGESDVNII